MVSLQQKGSVAEKNAYFDTIAKLLVDGNHGLIIEVVPPLPNPFYKSLERAGYEGKYLSLHPDSSIEIIHSDDEAIQSLETLMTSKRRYLSELWSGLRKEKVCEDLGFNYSFRGDAISDKDISDVIYLVKPENPVYVANFAIGTVLGSDESAELHDKSDLSEKSDVWARNLTKMPLNHVMMSDYILNSDGLEAPIESSGYYAGDEGISENVYSNLLDMFKDYGWNVDEISVTESEKSVLKIIDLKR